MKRLRAIAADADLELTFVRQGANHELWSLGAQRFTIPRHREINERTARGIITTAQEATRDGS
jgi:mRNA interferase HicA